jgi:hypothetical protein
MLRLGCIVLSVWTGFQLLLALGIVIAMTVLGHHAPALTILFLPNEPIETRALATIDSLAILGNSLIVAYCAAILVMTWAGVRRGVRWAFFAVAGSLLFVQFAGFTSDVPLGGRDLKLNLVSTALLLAGLVPMWLGLRAQSREAGREGRQVQRQTRVDDAAT